MRLKTMMPAAAVCTLAAAVALAVPASAWAQPPATQAPAQPSPTAPAGQAKPTPATPAPTGQPPATQTPTPAAPPPALKPSAPFPPDSKFGFVDINAIAANSTAGKEAANKLKALQDKKLAEINDKNKQLQATQQKLNTGGSVLNDSARAQLEKDVDRMQRDIQFTQQNAQAEYNELQEDLRNDFQKKLMPIIDALATEKGLYAIFSVGDAGAMYVHPGLDLTTEVVKRLDSGPVKKN